MQHVHVTAEINKSLSEVFTAVADHRRFLTGGGLVCHLVKEGTPNKNGLGAIRTVRTKKYTLTEEINEFIENKSFDYQIIDIKPQAPVVHHNGWLEFTAIDKNKTKVDWQSHFTFTTPIIGHFIGWLTKKQLEKIFLSRLNRLNQND
ncbi:MAG: SRPBCC family protein [Marinicella sp.]|nr:SRPBCC family protein [Xanthomonadales bacterium]